VGLPLVSLQSTYRASRSRRERLLHLENVFRWSWQSSVSRILLDLDSPYHGRRSRERTQYCNGSASPFPLTALVERPHDRISVVESRKFFKNPYAFRPGAKGFASLHREAISTGFQDRFLPSPRQFELSPPLLQRLSYPSQHCMPGQNEPTRQDGGGKASCLAMGRSMEI
jgi:hypothetical protein